MEKECLFCGNKFKPRRIDQIYCKPLCGSYQWRKLNPDRTLENKRRNQSSYIRRETPEQGERRRKHCAAYGHTQKGRYNGYKSAAKVRSLPFSLSFEEFLTFWGKPCSYCGDKIEKIGIDRVNNKSGYILGNCVSCCGLCNKMKLDHSYEELLSKCQQIINFNKTTMEA